MTNTPRQSDYATRRPLIWSPAAFSTVGAVACLIQLLVARHLVGLGLAPPTAIAIGFLAALGASFPGHRRWSIVVTGPLRRSALQRFLAAALLGFIVNETACWLLLELSRIDYLMALALAVFAGAAVTYAACRYWAFSNP